MVIKIEVCRIGTDSHSYRATFSNEEQALAFVTERAETHIFRELRNHQLPEDCHPDLYAALYPKCPHGLSLDLCAGPQHYEYDDDELRGMGYWASR